ncbi:MAG: hypothetical protein FRX49_03553 [Trebouxia sp. A1-2]|nr:MAG: hypothetical protein FRX49_03553 [Trebouxia sp. A1-2]
MSLDLCFAVQVSGGQTAHPLGVERSLPLPMPGGARRGVKADAGSRGLMAVRMGRGGLSSTEGAALAAPMLNMRMSKEEHVTLEASFRLAP